MGLVRLDRCPSYPLTMRDSSFGPILETKDRERSQGSSFEFNPDDHNIWLAQVYGDLSCWLEGGNTHTIAFLAEATQGRIEYMRSMIQDGIDVNIRDSSARATAAHYAAASGKADVLRFLHECRADINVKAENNGGYTPLHDAASSGHIEALRVLIELRAELDAKCVQVGGTAAHYAAYRSQWGAVRFLQESHADVSLPDNYGRTPMKIVITGYSKSAQPDFAGLFGWRRDEEYRWVPNCEDFMESCSGMESCRIVDGVTWPRYWPSIYCNSAFKGRYNQFNAPEHMQRALWPARLE